MNIQIPPEFHKFVMHCNRHTFEPSAMDEAAKLWCMATMGMDLSLKDAFAIVQGKEQEEE